MKHRWNTSHFEKYTDFLNRTDLNKLYPSESWCLYRTLTKSKNVLDCQLLRRSALSKEIKATSEIQGKQSKSEQTPTHTRTHKGREGGGDIASNYSCTSK